MADQARTEEPTPRRRREARRKGQVARSRDLTAAVSLWFVLAALCAMFGAVWIGATGGRRDQP